MTIRIEDALEQVQTLARRLLTEVRRVADSPLGRRLIERVPGGRTLATFLDRLEPSRSGPQTEAGGVHRESGPGMESPWAHPAPRAPRQAPGMPEPPAARPAPVASAQTPVEEAVTESAPPSSAPVQAPASPVPQPPVPPVPAGSRIRMLAGTYQGWGGVAQWSPAKSAYNVRLTGPDGGKARTTLSPSALGRVWEVEPPTRVKPGKPAEPVAPVPEAIPEAIPEAAPVETSSPGSRQPTSVVLPKGTPVRMLGGHYMGLSGVIASVQSRGGPDSIVYVLALVGPDGRGVRTTVKHASIGRMWVRAD